MSRDSKSIMASADSDGWSYEEEANLVQIWKDYRVLWDPTEDNFKQQTSTRKAIGEIAVLMKRDYESVKVKLKRLRDAWLRARKKQPSGSGTQLKGQKDQWLVSNLAFLEPSMDIRPSTTNMAPTSTKTLPRASAGSTEDAFDVPGSEEATIPSTSASASAPKPQVTVAQKREAAKKRKVEATEVASELVQVLKERHSKKDDVDIFCLSLAADLKELLPSQRPHVEHKIRELVYRCRAENMGQPSHLSMGYY